MAQGLIIMRRGRRVNQRQVKRIKVIEELKDKSRLLEIANQNIQLLN